jgi:hypothetical protein
MKKTNKPIRVAVHRDANGNQLIIDHYPLHANIKLKLGSETRSRNIGTIDFEKRTLSVRRQREAHLFRKMNAYGLNHYILKEAKLFDNVVLKDEKQEWAIPREFILDNGKFLNFSNHGGFELQIFIPLDLINQFQQKHSL